MTINLPCISTLQNSTWALPGESSEKSTPYTMFEDHDNEHNIKRSDNSSSFGNEEFDPKIQEEGKTQNIFFYSPYSFVEERAKNIYQLGLACIALANQILTGVIRLINFSVKCVTEIAFLSVHLIESLKFKIINKSKHKSFITITIIILMLTTS